MAVLVTRPHPDDETTAASLRARGFEVLRAPMLRFEPVAVHEDMNARYSAVIVTSANALRGIEFTSGGIFPHLAIPLVIHVQQPAQQFFPLIHRKRTGCFFDLVHRAHAEIVVTLILNRNIKRGSTIWNEISDVVRAQIDLRVIRDVWIVIVCASIQPDDRNADSCKNEYAIRNAERSRYRIRAHAT